MAVVQAGYHPIIKEVFDALGLEAQDCTSLVISFKADSLATVEAEYIKFMEVDNVKQLVPVFKRFYLKEIPTKEMLEARERREQEDRDNYKE